MELLLVIVAALAVLDLAALRWGADSRDGRDWQPRPYWASTRRG